MPSGSGASGGERVARKDRERARRRRAIQRARREAGYEPPPKAEQPAAKTAAKTRTAAKPAARTAGGGRPQAQQLLKKAQVGDVDRKGRVYERPMLLHPKIALYVYFMVLGVGLVSLLRRDPALQAVGYGAFAVGMLVIADSKTTWMRAAPFIVLAVALAAGAIALAIGLG
jgi:hypothetical protein